MIKLEYKANWTKVSLKFDIGTYTTNYVKDICNSVLVVYKLHVYVNRRTTYQGTGSSLYQNSTALQIRKKQWYFSSTKNILRTNPSCIF